MSSPDRSRSYLQVGSDRIHATTPVEFRQLLDHIKTRAGLTPGQIAVKAKIPRSQAYNMVAASRTSLPSKPDQVRGFVEACGLGPVDVGLVMSLWNSLDQQAREQAARPARSLADEGGASGGGRHEPAMQLSDSAAAAVNLGRMYRRRPTNRRDRTGYDFLFLILQDKFLVQRALLLMLPITLAFVSVVAALVVWAILQPEHTSVIAAIFAGILSLPIAGVLTRLTGRSRQ